MIEGSSRQFIQLSTIQRVRTIVSSYMLEVLTQSLAPTEVKDFQSDPRSRVYYVCKFHELLELAKPNVISVLLLLQLLLLKWN